MVFPAAARTMAKLRILAYFFLLLLTIDQCRAVPLESSAEGVPPLFARQDNGTTTSKEQPSYTYSNREPQWMSEPPVRGTFRVILSSLVTYLLCVWTTIHVNVEPPEEAVRLHEKLLPITRDSFLDRLLRKRIMRKLGWGVISLLAPEVTMWIAYFELQVAHRLCDVLTDVHKRNKLELTPRKKMKKKREVYLEPHGNSLDIQPAHHFSTTSPSPISITTYHKETVSTTTRKDEDSITPIHKEERPKTSKEEFAEKHYDPSHLKLGFYGVMGGFVLDQKVIQKLIDLERISKKHEHNVTLTPYGIYVCAKEGILPKVPIAEINDKSNADALAKFLICIQVGWMVIQVIGRAATNLPITLLELHIVLQCACAVTMYALWWHKPLDIHLPTTVFMTPEQEERFIAKFVKSVGSKDGEEAERQTMIIDPTNIAIRGYTEHKLVTSSRGLGKILYEQIFAGSEHETKFWEAIHYDFIGIHRRIFTALGHSARVSTILCILNIVWGALHLVAWNGDFPSITERMLWRVASVVTTSVLVLELIYIPCGQLVKKDESIWGRLYWNTGWFLWSVGIVPIVILRVVLAMQGFLSMRDLPEGSYKTVVWADMLPHY